MARVTVVPTPATLADEVCDFCGSRAIATVFMCQPSTTRVYCLPGQTHYMDDGEWDACVRCAQLVHADDRGALEAVALSVYGSNGADHLAFVAEMQAIFWRHLHGERPVA